MPLPRAVQPQQISPLGKTSSGKITPHQDLVLSSWKQGGHYPITAVAVVAIVDDGVRVHRRSLRTRPSLGGKKYVHDSLRTFLFPFFIIIFFLGEEGGSGEVSSYRMSDFQGGSNMTDRSGQIHILEAVLIPPPR